MNGFKKLLLLLLVAFTQIASPQSTWAQADLRNERDYGWEINPTDGVLEYIVQISPEKLAQMQLKSVQYPRGQENPSDMPRELVGRASRVVVRIGNEILPRVPSLEQLDRQPRITDPLSAGSTAMLPPGRMQDVESGVYNIQQRDTPPTLPALPNGLDSNLSSRGGNLIDEASKAAGSMLDSVNALRNDNSNSLSDALPAFPDPSALAQNFNNAQSGASDFLNSTRGAAGSGTKFNNTAPPVGQAPGTAGGTLGSATGGTSTSTGSGLSTPFPPANTNTNPLNNTNPARNPGSFGSGTNSATNTPSTMPSYPDPRLNQPTLGTPSTLPQQQTPSQGFGTSPGLANRPNAWNTSPTAPQTNPNYSQAQDPYASSTFQQNYTNAPAPNNQFGAPQNNQLSNPPYVAPNTSLTNPDYDRMAMGNTNLSQQTNQGRAPQGQTSLTGQQTSLQTMPNTLVDPTSKMDGVLQVLFLLSLVVNFYLGILIRKLLMRYRSLLTNVRQAAYT